MAGKRILDFCNDHWNGCPKRFQLEDKESKAATAILEILMAAEEGDFLIDSEEFFTDFEDNTKDPDWSPNDEVYDNMNVYDIVQHNGKKNMIKFGDGDYVDLASVQEAVTYYGSRNGTNNNGSKVRPPLETMKRLFWFIKDKHHISKLREYERNGTIKYDRKLNLEFLSNELKKEVTQHLQDGRILHDDTLRFLIAGIMKKHDLVIPNFVASDFWLNGWKRGFGLSSRKITKFVAQIRHKNKEQLEKDAKEFVEKTNQELSSYSPSHIYNADQSGFQLEMHTARTLAITGSQHVHCVVQNVSATTHSYTVLPLIAADGTLHDKLFITLKERNGKFPAKGHFNASNLIVTCHSSHIMTKELMKQFFTKIMFDPGMPKDSLLVVDSWTSWKDQDAIDSVTPASNKLKVVVIPAGCTGLVQPCDVGIFGSFKKVVKKITGHAQLVAPNHKMFSRDETLKMISLVWWQLCSPKLKGWAQYAWYACGYNFPRPPYFQTPAQYLFPRDVAKDCATHGCPSTSFIKCIYCEEHFCFADFVISYHKCC